MVTAPTPWKGGLVAISSFGFGGSNVHAIIAGCVRPQGPPPRALRAPEPLPSTEEAVEAGGTVIEEVQEEPLLFPPEVCPLIFLPLCDHLSGHARPAVVSDHVILTDRAMQRGDASRLCAGWSTDSNVLDSGNHVWSNRGVVV